MKKAFNVSYKEDLLKRVQQFLDDMQGSEYIGDKTFIIEVIES